jgi:hypothetical protein
VGALSGAVLIYDVSAVVETSAFYLGLAEHVPA